MSLGSSRRHARGGCLLCWQRFCWGIFFYQLHLKSVFLGGVKRHPLSILFLFTISKLSPNCWKLAKLGPRVMQQNFCQLGPELKKKFNSVLPTVCKFCMGKTFRKGMVSGLGQWWINEIIVYDSYATAQVPQVHTLHLHQVCSLRW